VVNAAAAANSGISRDSLPPPRPAREEVSVNSIRRLRRTLARRASSPGRAEPQARQPNGQEPYLAGRPGHDRVAARFIQHAAADASMAAGQDRPASPDHELPAGFWVGRNGGQTVRRPLVPACCQQLDPRSDHAIPSDS
jgi:hypothetical protein